MKYQHYTVKCNTIKANVSANINIVNIETGSLIYGDSISKEYNGDSCHGNKFLSKSQALNRLSSDIAHNFVYKLTPNYSYFSVTLLGSIELSTASSEDKKRLSGALEYIKAGRMDKAEKILTTVMDSVDGQSYVVAYDLGVVKEAQGQLDEAKKFYAMADDLTMSPVEEINAAVLRIDKSIEKNQEAREQLNAK
ncbi:hypothetical protein N9A28_07295 [Sulfurimonas sp.]|nr:hypothetical protein [Sulfurimonas sp.]